MEAEVIRARKSVGGDMIVRYNQTEGIYSQRLDAKLSAISSAGVQQAQRRIAAYQAFKEAEAATLLRRFQKDARLKQREHIRDTAAAIADVHDSLRGFATAFAKYVAIAARTKVLLDLAEYASLKRAYQHKVTKACLRIQRFVRYHPPLTSTPHFRIKHGACQVPHVQRQAHAAHEDDRCNEEDILASYVEDFTQASLAQRFCY